jgi:hypothetical protein
MSSQSGGGPPVQEPPEQVSAVVQALLSSQGLVLGEFTQPVAGLHESFVHSLPSLQSGGGPLPMHTPAEQVSPVVHAFPSLHGSLLGVFTQPVNSAQLSVVHGLLSLQSSAVPSTHWPAWQVSVPSQELASGQGVLSGRKASFGQAWLAVPLQTSAGSQRSPEPGLQTVPAGATLSAGQA